MNENINTIFYFPSTLTFTQYQDKLQSQEITPRTIVFAAAENAIYMGGREYGAVVPQSKVTPFVEPYQYDDSNLREQLAALDTALQAANRTAADQYAANQAFMNGIGATIQARIQELLANKDWTDGHLPSGSNFGQQEVESYLQRLGVWGENETHDKAHATWTEIAQTVDAISLSVSQLYDSGELTQGFKQAIVDIAIGDTVKTEIGSYIATNYIEDLDALGNKIIKVLEWLYSGMTSETSANSTFANLYSNAQIGTNSALSKISSAVTRVKNATGDFTSDLISTATITSQVNDSLATLKQSAGNNFVKTEIIGKIDQTNADIASIISEITGDSSNTTIANKISTWKSGLVTSATLDGATADLLSSNDSNSLKSGLITFVKNNAAQAELVAANDFTSASVVALVNGAGSSININADKINLVGQTTFLDAVGRNITAQKFNAIAYYSGSTVSTELNSKLGFYEVMDPTNGFEIGIKSRLNTSDDWNTTRLVHLHNTGQGELAGGLIAWDNSGINSNTRIDIGANLGTTTLHAAPKWNKRTNKWFLNHGTINIGTPISYLESQPYYETTQDNETVKVPITSENFASSPAATEYSSWDDLVKSGKTDVNLNGNLDLYGNLVLKDGGTISSFGYDYPAGIVISPIRISFYNPGGTWCGEIENTGHFNLGMNTIVGDGSKLIVNGPLVAGNNTPGSNYCASFSKFGVSRVKSTGNDTIDPDTHETIRDYWDTSLFEGEMLKDITNPIEGLSNIVEVVSGTLYFTVSGGLIIYAGSESDCIAALKDTWSFQHDCYRFANAWQRNSKKTTPDVNDADNVAYGNNKVAYVKTKINAQYGRTIYS